jgi:hypothetical protein
MSFEETAVAVFIRMYVRTGQVHQSEYLLASANSNIPHPNDRLVQRKRFEPLISRIHSRSGEFCGFGYETLGSIGELS